MPAAELVTHLVNDSRAFIKKIAVSTQAYIPDRDGAASAPIVRRNDDHVADPPEHPLEKRKTQRYVHMAHFICSRFNQGTYFPAVLLNYGKDGMYLETQFAVSPGTSLHLWMDKDAGYTSLPATRPGFRTAALGEVKWCRKLNGSSFRKYGIGIRFYMHY
jgi:hypothetical protein